MMREAGYDVRTDIFGVEECADEIGARACRVARISARGLIKDNSERQD